MNEERMIELATECERIYGNPHQHCQLMLEAYGLINPISTSETKFVGILHADGYIDAAMKLLPAWAVPNIRWDGSAWRWFVQLENSVNLPFKDYKAWGMQPALALTAACLRAWAEQGNPDG